MQTLTDFNFLPRPRRINPLPDIARVPDDIQRALTGPLPGIAKRCGSILKLHSTCSPPQGYRIEIRPGNILVLASDDAGAFYGLMTLRQLATHCADAWPCGIIEDAPDYPSRGVMLDISRDKVPTMDTLRMIVDELAAWKINHLELYTEHTFAYSGHRVVWENASPMTPPQISQLDAWCRERFIELVPNQNSFGHFERWLKHPSYQRLAYNPQHPTCLDPRNPVCLPLLEELYDELLPLFASTKFNVGCDETQVHGTDYIEFLNAIHSLVTRRDHVMHFWDDIVIRHPDLVRQLPRNLVALDWGYEAAHPFDEHGAQLAQAGIPFYVCPGTSSWTSLGGRTENCLANIRNAAVNGLRHRAIGLLNTDWGDHGHWQYWPVSYTGIVAGAAMSWSVAANETLDIAGLLNTHVFTDPTGVTGQLLRDLGAADKPAECPMINSNILFHWLHDAPDGIIFDAVSRDQIEATHDGIRALKNRISDMRSPRPDAHIIRDETTNAVNMMELACLRARWIKDPHAVSVKEYAARMAETVAQHRRLWLARNRPGGLDDSAHRLSSCSIG
jgi:hypothetical protein